MVSKIMMRKSEERKREREKRQREKEGGKEGGGERVECLFFTLSLLFPCNRHASESVLMKVKGL